MLSYNIDMIDTDECLLWAKYKSPKGYGRICLKRNGVWKIRTAHRELYEAEYGKLPKHLVVDHLCRVTACINLDHLEPVTNAENIRRGVFKKSLNPVAHCKSGHEFTKENTFWIRNGRARQCKKCRSRWAKEQYIKRKTRGYYQT